MQWSGLWLILALMVVILGVFFVIRSLRRNNLVLESEALGVKPNMDYQLFQEMKGNCRLELRVQIKSRA